MSSLDILAQSFPPRTKFTERDVPDLSGKVCIVTGGNSGIGKETVRVLLAHNAKVYMAARSQEKADAAIKELKEETGKAAVFLKLDLGDLKTIKETAADFLSKESDLHILFNNAGVMMPPIDERTKNGYDLQFGANVLGPYFLTKLLLPALLAGAKSSFDDKARVVNTSSGMHVTNKLSFKDVLDDNKRQKAGAQPLYALSKFSLIMYSAELARRYGDQGLVVTSLHPGIIKTDLHRHMKGALGAVISVMERTVLHDVSHGALTQLYAGTSAAGKDFNGKYLIPWARIGKPHPGTQDLEASRELWEWLDTQVTDVK